jgi:hypothetical protein
MAFLCVSQQGYFKNTKNTFWKKSMSKPFYKEVEGKNTFFPIVFFFFPSVLFIAFLAVSLHDELKNTTKRFSKTRNLTGTSQKKISKKDS